MNDNGSETNVYDDGDYGCFIMTVMIPKCVSYMA